MSTGAKLLGATFALGLVASLGAVTFPDHNMEAAPTSVHTAPSPETSGVTLDARTM